MHARKPTESLIHHFDRGSQYVSIRYTERMDEAGIKPSVGSGGDSYDNALAESVIGLFKTEVIHPMGPWKSFEAVEYKNLERIDWFHHQRLLEPIGNIPPAEAQPNYYAALENLKMAAWNSHNQPSGKSSAIHKQGREPIHKAQGLAPHCHTLRPIRPHCLLRRLHRRYPRIPVVINEASA